MVLNCVFSVCVCVCVCVCVFSARCDCCLANIVICNIGNAILHE